MKNDNRFKPENIPARLRRTPMAAAVVCLAAGIAAFDRFGLPAVSAWAGFAVLVAAALRMRDVSRAAPCILAALFFLGGMSAAANRRTPTLPVDMPLYMEVEAADVPVVRDDGSSFVAARVLGFGSGDEYRMTKERVRLWCDATLTVECGDRIACFGAVRPFDGEGYGALMARRGYAGTLFLRAADTVWVARGVGRRTLHAAAVERLSRLDLTPAAHAVVIAMGAGERGWMPDDLRTAYSRVGVSHILAVSGLHTGIVLMLANFLLWWVAVFRHGHIIRALLVALSVWTYVLMCGAAPSAVRAAVMFTILQLSVSLSSSYNPANSLCGAAFLMLAADPDMLFEAGFQLSFAAVAAVVSASRLFIVFSQRTGTVMRFVWSTVLVGVIATIGTAPLTSHLFGHVPLTGVIINPVIIICAYAVIILSAMWIVMPMPMLAPLFAGALQRVADLQNETVSRFAEYDFLRLDGALPAWCTAGIYLFALAWIAVLGCFDWERRGDILESQMKEQ